jgi:hypothetical protein
MVRTLRLCDRNIFDFIPVSSNCLKRLDEIRISAANPLRRKGHRSCCRAWGKRRTGAGSIPNLDFDFDFDFDTDRTAQNSSHHEAVTRP